MKKLLHIYQQFEQTILEKRLVLQEKEGKRPPPLQETEKLNPPSQGNAKTVEKFIDKGAKVTNRAQLQLDALQLQEEKMKPPEQNVLPENIKNQFDIQINNFGQKQFTDKDEVKKALTSMGVMLLSNNWINLKKTFGVPVTEKLVYSKGNVEFNLSIVSHGNNRFGYTLTISSGETSSTTNVIFQA